MSAEPARCRSCRRPIEYLRTERGNVIPVDLEPDPDGAYIVVDGIFTYGERAPLEWRAGAERRTSHFATCPNAHAHRRKVAT